MGTRIAVADELHGLGVGVLLGAAIYCTMTQYDIYKHCSLVQYINSISCIEMQSHEIELL